MSAATRTDRSVSIASPEFVWDFDGEPEANRFILPALVRILRGTRATKLLDLGCGNGHVAGTLSALGYEVTGMDQSTSGLEIARTRFPGVSFLSHDLGDPLPEAHTGRYDCVIAIEAIEHLLLPRKLMAAALAALRPGGTLVVSTPFHGYWKNLALALTGGFDKHWHPLRDFGHVKFFSRATLTALFAEFGLSDLQFQTVGRFPPFARSMILSGIKLS
jgi:2-polyprenyl-6-hydroxyphenyl methylase/3-demethylubiquinone-9 3-methyltransferase